MSQKIRASFQWQIQLTERCNLHCAHCYGSTCSGESLSTEKLNQVLDEIIVLSRQLKRVPMIGFTGGEPLMSERLLPALDHLKKRRDAGAQVNAALMTNGMLLTRRTLEELRCYAPMLFLIQVSLDGATAPEHDSLRGEGSFERAIEGIREACRVSEVRTTISCTLSRRNMRCIDDLIALAKQLGVRRLSFSRFVPTGRGAAIGEEAFTPEEARDVLTRIRRRSVELERGGRGDEFALRLGRRRPLTHATYYRCMSDEPDDVVDYVACACSVGVSSLTILMDGTVLPCRRLPLKAGDLREEGLLTIWLRSPIINAIRNRFEVFSGKCTNCRLFREVPHLCGGGAPCMAYAYHGRYDLPDPHCWVEPPG